LQIFIFIFIPKKSTGIKAKLLEYMSKNTRKEGFVERFKILSGYRLKK